MRTVRKADINDIDAIMVVLEDAKRTMRSSGNNNQWSNGYPSSEVIENDILQGGGYIIEDEEDIIAYFAFLKSPEPTYFKIFEGNWIDDEKPYYVVHRIGGKRGSHNVFKDIMDFCFSRTDNVRIDTHRDNKIMQHVIEKAGFTYCGIIYLASGDERLAYQKIVY